MNISRNKTSTEGPNDNEDMKIWTNSAPPQDKGNPNVNIIWHLI
jgi:hypothetical protein